MKQNILGGGLSKFYMDVKDIDSLVAIDLNGSFLTMFDKMGIEFLSQTNHQSAMDFLSLFQEGRHG